MYFGGGGGGRETEGCRHFSDHSIIKVYVSLVGMELSSISDSEGVGEKLL